MSTKAPFHVDRIVSIRARRSTVFRYFTDSARFAAWWGTGSSIDPQPGGKVEIRYPNGATAGGEVVEIVEGERIVFTYGYDDADKPIARGGSRVTITLEDEDGGTKVTLVHLVDTEAARDAHVPGWRFQLSMFANAVAKEEEATATELVDRFFALWSEESATKRETELEQIATPDVGFHDAFACLRGASDLSAHVDASRLHMPGTSLAREGAVLFCQGTALVDWTASGPKGPLGRGTNVFELVGGRIRHVTGFWRTA